MKIAQAQREVRQPMAGGLDGFKARAKVKALRNKKK